MKDITQLQGVPVKAEGYCQVDYKDPDTGKTLERIEGKNHVFIDQFYGRDFQTTALKSTLLLTDGESALDTTFPWIPGKPVGYGEPNSAASGIFRGAYRERDSYLNAVSKNKAESFFVYDFLPSQIPDTIRYVGLTGSNGVGASHASFYYTWPTLNTSSYGWNGIYDIERRKWIGYLTYGTTTGSPQSITNLRIRYCVNEPGEVPSVINLSDICDFSISAWDPITLTPPGGSPISPNRVQYENICRVLLGYDFENEYIAILVTASRQDGNSSPVVYTSRFKDELWLFSSDGTQSGTHLVSHKTIDVDSELTNVTSATNPWPTGYKQFWADTRFGTSSGGVFRISNDIIMSFSSYKPNHTMDDDCNILYLYKYNTTSGAVTRETISAGNYWPVGAQNNKLYVYKNNDVDYMWCRSSSYFTNCTIGGVNVDVGNGLYSNFATVNPVYDLLTGNVYSFVSVPEPFSQTASNNYSYLIEKGQTNIFGNVWNMKTLDTNSIPELPFAYTAYRLPLDAPARPEGSAVTVTYKISVLW